VLTDVATSTPLDREWTNSRVIDGALVDFVRNLKALPGGDIGVHGSIFVTGRCLLPTCSTSSGSSSRRRYGSRRSAAPPHHVATFSSTTTWFVRHLAGTLPALMASARHSGGDDGP
jgi:hypothetical protein